MHIGIIGAGHAGVTAARRASERGARVTLFSGESVPPYFRPRVVAFAFGLTEEDRLYMHPPEWYAEHNIDLRLTTSVKEIDPSHLEITTFDNRTNRFDAIIIASGAQPVVLPWERKQIPDVLPLWSLADAKTLKHQLPQKNSVTIVGGGFTGIETAIYAAEQGKSATLVELKDRLLPQFLGKTAAAILLSQLIRRNVTIKTGTTIRDVDADTRPLHAHTESGSVFDADLIITAVGGAPAVPFSREVALDTDRGIRIKQDLTASVPGIFACGDVAQVNGWSMGNATAATTEGRIAGENAAAYVQGDSFSEAPLSVNAMDFKHKEFEIHVSGDQPGPGRWEKELPGSGDNVYRGVVVDETNIVKGVQMVGTGEGFRTLVRHLGSRWDRARFMLRAT